MDCIKLYSVYVQSDEAGRVIAINSNAFIFDFAGWIKIDEGCGDKYHHAQGNYLPKPIMDERGIYRYKLKDGQVVERTQAEMDADYIPPVPVPSDAERIVALEEENKQMKEALNLLLSGATEEGEADG